MSSNLDKGYGQILITLKEKIKLAQQRASWAVNTQLLQVYWEIGKTIGEYEQVEGWGAKTVENLSKDLRFEFSEMKGLSPRNLRYMRDFAKAYPSFPFLQDGLEQNIVPQSILQPAVAKLQVGENQHGEFVQPVAAQLPWTHHTIIIEKIKSSKERLFYIHKAIANGWSKSVLIHQIESDLFNRQGGAITNFELTLPRYQSDLARETFKSPYLFDFLNLGEEVHERELEKALILHIKKFLLELGRGFAFVGNQQNLNIGGDDFFLDLLFYNYHLHCFVVFELKVGEFVPEFAGKLNFYINAIDQQIKGTDDNPTIGVLLCKTPNKTVVKYALTGIQSPMGVAEYELINALPKRLRAQMPTVEELEKELETPQKSLDVKLARIKELTSQMKGESLKEKDRESIIELFSQTLPKLIERLEARLESIIKEFDSRVISRILNDQHNFTTDVDLEAKLLKEGVHKVGIHVQLQGFIKAGTKTFNIWKELKFELHPYFYHIKTYTNQDIILVERLYDQQWTEFDLDELAEGFAEIIADDVEQNIKRIQG